MDDCTTLSVAEFLDRLADRTPTPGGGGVTGLAGALACAMARMVAAYSMKKDIAPAVRARVEAGADALARADQLMRALMMQDARAYTAMTAAAKAARQDPAKQPAHERAVLGAIAVPMEMAEVASDALSAMDQLKGDAGAYLLSDLGIAAVLACATANAARYSVGINTRALSDSQTRARILSDIGRVVDGCEDLRASIEVFVRTRLSDGGGE